MQKQILKTCFKKKIDELQFSYDTHIHFNTFLKQQAYVKGEQQTYLGFVGCYVFVHLADLSK